MSDGRATILWIAILFVFAYLMFIRPARKRAAEVQQLQQALSRGDEIMLTSGIFGEVVDVVEDKVVVEVSPGVVLTVHRGAVGKIVHDVPVDDEPEAAYELESDGSIHADDGDEPTDGEQNPRGAH